MGSLSGVTRGVGPVSDGAPAAAYAGTLSVPAGLAASHVIAGTPGGAPGPGQSSRYAPPQDPELALIWDAVSRLTETVQKDHAERLGRMERDLKWVMRITTALLAAVIGAVAGNMLPG